MRNGLLGGDDIRMWRARHRLTRPRASIWFGKSVRWLERVEMEHESQWPKNLHEVIMAAFVRFYGLDALARLGEEATKPEESVRLTKEAIGNILDTERMARMTPETREAIDNAAQNEWKVNRR